MNIWIKSILFAILVIIGGVLLSQTPFVLAYIISHWPMPFKIGLAVFFFVALVLMWRGVLDK